MSRLPLLRALFIALLVGGAARAQAPVVERPKVTGDTSVGYPEGAKGDAVVVLELVLDAEGAVSDVTAVSGDPVFAEPAVKSAWRWRFEPARRDGNPVPARIRFEVRFREPPPPAPSEQPAPELEPTTTPGPAVTPVSPPARAQEQIEVTVYGHRRSPAARTLTRAEVRELPGAFGDPFRAIEVMPGVTPIVSGVPYFFLRGAPPGNVGYFLDGIRVPLLFHVGLGPSVVHPGIIERVDLYAGAYPARFGRFAGGIVAGETAAPRPELHGEASVRLVDAGALVEAPLDGGRGAVLVGGRYSYTGLLFSLVQSEAVLEYWDYQARASYEVGPRDTLGVFSFGAYDYVGEKDAGGKTETVLSTEFHRVDLRWQHEASANTTSRFAVAVGLDRTMGDEDEEAFFVRDRLVSVRETVEHRPDKKTLITVGSDLAIDYFDVQPPPLDAEDPDDRERFDRFFPTRTDLATGLFSELSLEVERGITLTPGLRVDLYASDGAAAVAVEPRITARFALSPTVRTIHTLGVAHQPPSFVIPVPGFQIGGLKGGLQRALQSSAGVEADLPEDFTGSLTLFQNAFFDMTDAIGGGRGSGGDRFQARSIGASYGAEVLVKRALTKKLGGYLSYTLSRSTRSIGRESFPAAFDRTHVLNLALGYDLGRRWRAGTRFFFYTGFPADEAGDGRLRSEHPPRVPAFHRVDVRLEKKWRLGKRGYWAFVLEVLNATLSKEVVDVDCEGGTCREREIGPVTIPSIGVEAAF